MIVNKKHINFYKITLVVTTIMFSSLSTGCTKEQQKRILNKAKSSLIQKQHFSPRMVSFKNLEKIADLEYNPFEYPENLKDFGKADISNKELIAALKFRDGKAWIEIPEIWSDGQSSQCAALVTFRSIKDTASMKRPPFPKSAIPSGYAGNNKVMKLNGYHGLIYNKSQTLAWSLLGSVGGKNDSSNLLMQKNNLTTGTRAQSVGTNRRSNGTAGGMAYAETKIKNFVFQHPHNPVYYVVSPIYQDDEKVPRGSIVQAVSTKDKGVGLNINVYVFNAQDGVDINYSTGHVQAVRAELPAS